MKKLILTIIMILSFSSMCFAQEPNLIRLGDTTIKENNYTVFLVDNFTTPQPKAPCFRYGDEGGFVASLLYYINHCYIILSMETKYKSNNNIVYSCKYHVVWCPKYRRKVLIRDVERRLKELIIQICAERQIEIIEMEIMPDHVHLLCEVDPQYGIHKAIREIKGTTSRILRQEFKHLTTKLPTLWTNSYFVSTVGGAPLEVIKQYVENQKTSQRK